MAARSITASADDAGLRAELADPAATVRFMLAGKAHVTFQSRKTGTRFTYRINETPPWHSGKRQPLHFVAVLTGPDHYEYLGCVYDCRAYSHGRASRIDRNAPSAVAFMWVWSRLTAGEMHPELAVYHEGRCGRCGRRLTTPESISIGLGPKCRGER
ncbi:hypothetical protein LCGC14_2986030 [marine sediment metagenome]|uniref:Uncharacterized protein n=1 Tax=marine sediment metagenome TaxID=412755 RepID=A0A0F8X631_9ZZZZ